LILNNRKTLPALLSATLLQCLLLLFVIGPQAVAQNDQWQPVYEQITTKQGLPSMEVYMCLQDDDGYLWFATDRGVARYNGHEFKYFTTDDGLASNTVFRFVKDDLGRIWFLSGRPELCYYDKGKIYTYQYNDQLVRHFTDFQYYSFSEITSETVALANLPNGAISIDKNGVVLELESRGAESEEASVTLFEHNGRLIHSQRKIVIKGDRVQPFYVNLKDIKRKGVLKLDYNNPLYGRIQNSEHIYFTNSNMLSVFGPESTWKKLFDKRVISASTLNGLVWISLEDKGIYACSLSGDSLKVTAHYFPSYSVTHVSESKEGHMWFCTRDDGVFKVPNLKIQKLEGHSSLNKRVYSLAGTGDSILVHTDAGQVLAFVPGKVFSEKPLNQSAAKSIGLVTNAVESEIYFNTKSERTSIVQRYSGGSFTGYLDNLNLHAARKMNDSTWLFGTYQGLHLMQNGKLALVKKLAGGVRALEIKNEDQVWVGNHFGLQLLNLKTNSLESPSDSILNQRVNDIKTTAFGTLFATSGNGLLIKTANGVEQLTSNDGIGKNFISKIRTAKNGGVWLLDNYGLTFFNRDSTEGDQLIPYSTSTFMADKIYDCLDDGVHLYIASNNGLMRMLVEESSPPSQLPKLYILDSKVNGKSSNIEGLELKHDENNMVVRYESVSYQKGSISYRYKSHPADKWTLLDAKVVHMRSLVPQNYQFEVQATADGINWTPSQKITFTIQSPFWATWWFITILILVGLALVVFIVILIVKFQKKKHQRKQRMTRLQQEALTRQMNPHFVFNAMGSLQNSILKGDTLQANKYLIKFSRLLRSGLDASRNELISLEEDLQLMEHYLSVEQTRLEDKLTFEVIHKNIDSPGKYLISPFLLQPYVENAVKHGIAALEGKGHVIVSYEHTEKGIECSIIDNGVGRKAAAKLSSARPDHQSHGNDIARDRIALVCKLYNHPNTLRIDDIYDTQGKVRGISVKFTVPIICT
jgi:ligand-binding sensor domain-containing protein